MEHLKFVFFILTAIFIASCSNNDEPDAPDKTPDASEEINLVGVWTSDDYIMSFDNTGFYSAYIADKFIDSGNFVLNGNTATCSNSYFNRVTVYEITNYSSKSLTATIKYVDFQGNEKSKTLIFTKSGLVPATKENPAIGKSWSSYSQYFGYVTYQFSTYNKGVKTAQKGTAKKYPIDFYYIIIDNRCYYQFLMNKSQVPTIGDGQMIIIQ